MRGCTARNFVNDAALAALGIRLETEHNARRRDVLALAIRNPRPNVTSAEKPSMDSPGRVQIGTMVDDKPEWISLASDLVSFLTCTFSLLLLARRASAACQLQAFCSLLSV